MQHDNKIILILSATMVSLVDLLEQVQNSSEVSKGDDGQELETDTLFIQVLFLRI
jgi:hypothetical protein